MKEKLFYFLRLLFVVLSYNLGNYILLSQSDREGGGGGGGDSIVDGNWFTLVWVNSFGYSKSNECNFFMHFKHFCSLSSYSRSGLMVAS